MPQSSGPGFSTLCGAGLAEGQLFCLETRRPLEREGHLDPPVCNLRGAGGGRGLCLF